jgi:hypothetical protein
MQGGRQQDRLAAGSGMYAPVHPIRGTCADSRGQLLQQCLGLFQIERVEPFGEPAVDRSEKLASFILLALIALEAGETHRGAEFPGLRLLLARNR